MCGYNGTQVPPCSKTSLSRSTPLELALGLRYTAERQKYPTNLITRVENWSMENPLQVVPCAGNPPFQARRLIAALAPADAKSCLPLAVRPATRGRLLLAATGAADAVVLVPPLVRFDPV